MIHSFIHLKIFLLGASTVVVSGDAVKNKTIKTILTLVELTFVEKLQLHEGGLMPPHRVWVAELGLLVNRQQTSGECVLRKMLLGTALNILLHV